MTSFFQQIQQEINPLSIIVDGGMAMTFVYINCLWNEEIFNPFSLTAKGQPSNNG